ncbi:NADH-quinone oxidoreductase subunit M [Paraglaciecola polaris]|uniref:complex I subunit 4 family protein n=1 Tax=Paraglaciecola polaris TaxID=222814 RepID=UPI0030EC495E|tara:strand:- start:3874 stop:5325 length:1452 start_codon:yes stop_codon:yes gene_type:complete
MVALSWLIWLPLLCGALAWTVEKRFQGAGNWITLSGLIGMLLLVLYLGSLGESTLSWDWFARFNIHFALWFDGLALLMVILTIGLAILALAVSWREITQHQGFFHFNLMFSIAGIIGVFLAADLFLFFLFWEVMLLPMTALILIWGNENRRYAAIKFFIFTQASSLLMLVAIIALALEHQTQTGQLSFSLSALANLSLDSVLEWWLMLGFFIAFAVKLPMVPLHSWLPDAHTQAPTAGSVLLAGILLKTGAYGLIRIVLPLFPDASMQFAPIAVTLGVLSIIYGALMAYSQTDFKRLVAYSSISHMGFVLLALFSWREVAFQGAILTIVAHGISSAALFSMAGIIQHRIHSRELGDMGGMWANAPKMATVTLIFVMAGIGMPGLANFNGELLTLLGSYQTFPTHTIVAALGIIWSAVYGLHLFQRAFQGPMNTDISDLHGREVVYTSLLILALFYFGLQPHILLELSADTLNNLLEIAKEHRP